MARKKISDITEQLDHGERNGTAPKPTNHLKLRIDDLKTFQPLTANQKKFFDAYKQGDYFVALHGVAGTGKCIGEDEEVDLLVTDELFELLRND